MSNNIITSADERLLFNQIQYLRLWYDFNALEKQIQQNAQKEYSSDSSFINFFTDVGNSIRQTRTDSLMASKEKLVKEIYRFQREKEYDACKIESFVQEKISTFFGNKNPELAKALFSLSLIFDHEYEYIYRDENLKYASYLLYGDWNTLSEYEKWFTKNYADLARQPMTSAQKGLLAAVGVGTVALVLSGAIASVGGVAAAGSTTTHALAGVLGLGDMQLGVGAIAALSAIVMGATMSATYVGINHYNRQAIIREFRNMNFNDSVMLLTIRVFLEHVAKSQNMSAQERKERLNELFSLVSDLKSDTDYILFVERQNVAENRKKIEMFHRFDNKMIEILGV